MYIYVSTIGPVKCRRRHQKCEAIQMLSSTSECKEPDKSASDVIRINCAICEARSTDGNC